MIPKTKIQKRVWSLRHKLRKLTKKQMDWAFDISTSFSQVKKKTIICLDCTHEFKRDTQIIIDEHCPQCNAKLHPLEGKQRTAKEVYFVAILCRIKEFQVIRYYMVRKSSKAKEFPVYFIENVGNIYINEKGKYVTTFMLRSPFWIYRDGWQWHSEVEIRSNSLHYQLNDPFIYPKLSLLPIVKRNGFNGTIPDDNPVSTIVKLLTDTRSETLYKAGYYELFGYCTNLSLDHYWNTFKICIRHHYPVEHPRYYIDYLNMLERLNRDINNPKYIFPNNIKEAHDNANDKLIQIQQKDKMKKMKAQWAKMDEEYKLAKAKYLDLKLSDGEIVIKPLQDMSDFYREGKELSHCVYSNGYYDETDSLILSARVDNVRVETIEFSLTNKSVRHYGGRRNSLSDYHQKIQQLIIKNANKIINPKLKEK